MPLVMQELLTIRKHLSATPIFSEFVLFNLQFHVQFFVRYCFFLCPFSSGHCIVFPSTGVFSLPSCDVQLFLYTQFQRDPRGRDCTVVYLQIPMHSVSINTKVVSPIPVHGEMYWIQQYLLKFVSDLGQVDRWFSPGTPVSSINTAYCHDINVIRLKVALITIKPSLTQFQFYLGM